MIDAQLIVGTVHCCHSLRGSVLLLCPSPRVVRDRWLVCTTPHRVSAVSHHIQGGGLVEQWDIQALSQP